MHGLHTLTGLKGLFDRKFAAEIGTILISAAMTLLTMGCVGGCAGTTSMDAQSGQSRSIGHQTAGYAIPDTLTWNAVNAPSHVTLSDQGHFDVISPIQPSVVAVRVSPEGDTPLDVFLSSSADYHFDSAKFTRSAEGELLLVVEGFGADRATLYNHVLVQVQKQLIPQVEAGSMTQREMLQVMGAVAEAVIAAMDKLPVP